MSLPRQRGRKWAVGLDADVVLGRQMLDLNWPQQHQAAPYRRLADHGRTVKKAPRWI
jgi:hypothetical protein